jgi:hypothetical protein
MKLLFLVSAVGLCLVPWSVSADDNFPNKLEALGQGAVTSHGLAGCQFTMVGCTIGSAGEIKGDMIGDATFTSTLTIDYSTYRSNGSGGGCAQASGDFIVNSSNGVIRARQVGFLCEVGATGLSAHTFNATYWIDPKTSTGKFAGASGSGNLTASDDGPTGSNVLSHLSGVIKGVQLLW